MLNNNKLLNRKLVYKNAVIYDVIHSKNYRVNQ